MVSHIQGFAIHTFGQLIASQAPEPKGPECSSGVLTASSLSQSAFTYQERLYAEMTANFSLSCIMGRVLGYRVKVANPILHQLNGAVARQKYSSSFQLTIL